MKFGKGYENYTKEEQARIALGRQVASEGMVLLENNGALPLKPDAKVALFGVGQIGFLHGGSGSGDDNLNRCAREGICKVNVYTDLYLEAMKDIKTVEGTGAADYITLVGEVHKGLNDCLKHYYKVFETKAV